MDPTPIDDFIARNLNEHFERYTAFSRMMLSLAAGSLSLLVALGGQTFAPGRAPWLLAIAFALLCVSVLAGVLVQWRLVFRPFRENQIALAHTARAADRGEPGAPIVLRKTPSLVERLAFQLQTWSFVAAFVALAAQGMLQNDPNAGQPPLQKTAHLLGG